VLILHGACAGGTGLGFLRLFGPDPSNNNSAHCVYRTAALQVCIVREHYPKPGLLDCHGCFVNDCYLQHELPCSEKKPLVSVARLALFHS
jgi:hypothetical protein